MRRPVKGVALSYGSLVFIDPLFLLPAINAL
jgi:hypothetical protein